MGEKRTVKTLLTFFHWLGPERSAALRFICSDMWKPYLKVIAKKAGQAIHVLDRFHIMGHFGKAIDEVRAEEAREIKARGQEPVLTKTRWLLLKRPENLTEKQEVRLADLLRYNLRSVRSYLLKEDFQFFWGYRSPYWAGRFLDQWCTRTMRSKIGPMKRVARMLRGHRPLILNWFPGQRPAFERRGRGLQCQGQTHYQKGLRFSDLSWAGSRLVSYTAPYPSRSSPTDFPEET